MHLLLLYEVNSINQSIITYTLLWPAVYSSKKQLTNLMKQSSLNKLKYNKKLSCRRETAQRFVSLNILLGHSRSLKVIRKNTIGRV